MTNYVDHIPQVKPMITNLIATAAIVSPVWLPWLDAVSVIAALLVPILGAVWLGTQILQVWTHWDQDKHD